MRFPGFIRLVISIELLLYFSPIFGQQTGAKLDCEIPALETQAANGNAKAQYDLGQCYAVGKNVNKDLSQAAFWFRRAAEQGLVTAQARLGSALLYGWGVAQNTSEAVAWYQMAAEHGDLWSASKLGQLYEDGGPIEMNQNSNGTYSAGPVPRNAAIPIDLVRAVSWFRAAATQGDALSQNHLGSLYLDGKGVPQDYTEAYFWLSLGEAGGIPSSTNGVDDRDLAASHLTKAALLQVQERARKWFQDHPGKSR